MESFALFRKDSITSHKRRGSHVDVWETFVTSFLMVTHPLTLPLWVQAEIKGESFWSLHPKVCQLRRCLYEWHARRFLFWQFPGLGTRLAVQCQIDFFINFSRFAEAHKKFSMPTHWIWLKVFDLKKGFLAPQVAIRMKLTKNSTSPYWYVASVPPNLIKFYLCVHIAQHTLFLGNPWYKSNSEIFQSASFCVSKQLFVGWLFLIGDFSWTAFRIEKRMKKCVTEM